MCGWSRTFLAKGVDRAVAGWHTKGVPTWKPINPSNVRDGYTLVGGKLVATGTLVKGGVQVTTADGRTATLSTRKASLSHLDRLALELGAL